MEFILKNHHKYNFTTIYNSFAQDKTLSLEAKGLALYLFSMPPSWCINPTQLRFELQIGKDKVTKLINELIENGYMFKHQKDIVFSKRGELRNIYYFSDDKEILKETTEIFRNSTTQSQLPMSEIPCTEIAYAENLSHINKDITQEENNKKETTVLTSNISIRTFLKEVLDEVTIINLLSAKPDLTIEEFKNLYEMANLEFKNGYCNSVNACLVRAVSGKWNFKHKTSPINFNEEELKVHRVLKGKLNYYIDYFQISSCSKNEILSKFLSECQKYNENLVNSYYIQLKEKLESN